MSGTSNTPIGRLDLGQAMKRWPDETFVPLGGAVFHAVESRYTPTLLCTARCGFMGYAPAAEFEAQTDEPICLRCQRQLRFS